MTQPTISDAPRVSGPYAATASAGPFVVTFPLFDSTGADLIVEQDGVALTGWALTCDTAPGWMGAPNTYLNGAVTLASPVTGNVLITGQRRPRRTGQYAEGKGVPARDMNFEWNVLSAMAREVYDRVADLWNRALHAPRTDGAIDMTLPGKAARANYLLGFDANGLPLLVAGLGPLNAAAAAATTQAAAAQAAAASATSAAAAANTAATTIPATVSSTVATALVPVQNKQRSVFSPYDYGAVPGHENDGTGTDQAPFINSAIAAAVAAGGGTVRVPQAVNGAWLIKSQILIAGSNVTLEGEGGAVALYDTRTGGNLFQIGDSAHIVYYSTVRGFTVTSPAIKTSGAAFSMSWCNWVTVEQFHGNNLCNGVNLTGQYNNVTFEDVEINLPGHAIVGTGFYVFMDPAGSGRGDSLYMKHCIVQAYNAGSHGYYLDGNIQTWMVRDCQALGTRRGLQIVNSAHSSTKVPSFGTFDNFQTDRALDVSVVVDTGYRIVFLNCDIQNTSGAMDSPYPQGSADSNAFIITSGLSSNYQPNDIQIIGGRIGNCRYQALVTNGYFVRCSNVTFGDASKAANTYAVVEVGPSAYGNRFTNCDFLGFSRATYGIAIDTGAQLTGLSMCLSIGYVTSTVYDAGTGTKKDVANNFI